MRKGIIGTRRFLFKKMKRREQSMKKFLSLLLAVVMVLSCVPGTAKAADVEAKWGKDINSLTESGTLEDAL